MYWKHTDLHVHCKWMNRRPFSTNASALKTFLPFIYEDTDLNAWDIYSSKYAVHFVNIFLLFLISKSNFLSLTCDRHNY